MKFKRRNCIFIMLLFCAAISCKKTEEPAPVPPPPVVSEETTTTEDPPAPPADTTSQQGAYHEYKVLPQVTDSAIASTEEPHYAYVDTRIQLRNKLLLFMGGTNTDPKYFTQFSRAAAALGCHVINIKYPNAVTARVCEQASDMACFTRYHEGVVFGGNQSEFVHVNKANSIMNRAAKLLQYLHAQDTTEGWDHFYSGDDLNWTRLIVAGHSQGGDHAAYLAYRFAVDRLIVLCAPNDFSYRYDRPADWCGSKFATSPDRIYGLMHRRDELVPPAEHYAAWKAMKMLSVSDTTSADGDSYRGFQALYTDVEPNPAANKYRSRHNAPIIDEAIPAGAVGEHLREVWKYLLNNGGLPE